MIENIVIREAVTEEERSLFWERLRAYFCRDIFPDPEDEDRPYFLGDDYRRTMESLRTRPVHPVHWLVFSRNGQDVGFALAAVFTGEDGKCFILEFCVLPEHLGGGMGTACARTLLNWAREQGAGYAELNCTTPPRQRFWGRLGFVANGADEWGVPLMLLPPREHRPITVERLTDPTDWQLGKLENGYRQDIGEEPPDGGAAGAADPGRPGGEDHLPGGQAGWPGCGHVLGGGDILHLCLRTGWSAGGFLCGAGIPPQGRGPAAGAGRPGTVPGAEHRQPDGMLRTL